MDENNFNSLIDKYLEGRASAAEKVLLEEYYRRLETTASTQLDAGEETVLKEAMFQQIRSGMRPRLVSLQKKIYFCMAGAAAVLLLLVSGYWFFETGRHSNKPQSNIVSLALKDIQPGHDAAILTLADGKQILLDSATGIIGKQAGITVINLNGLLSYKTKDKSDKIIYNTIATARGNQYQLLLADGSKIWLNSASSLRFPVSFTDSVREVELLTGEAYFEIARNPSKPFHVRTSDLMVEVLGTHFNVNAYSEDGPVKTTLVEGSVKLSMGNSSPGLQHTSVLLPRQQAVWNENKFLISEPDIAQVVAWKNGQFEFDNTDLATIMKQISRWYDIDVSYKEKPSNEKFGGSISMKLPLSDVLKLLEENGIGFKLEEKKLIVQP